MALFIRDDSVDALATQLQRALRASTKTEAVRIALQHELDRTRRKQPLRQRVQKAQAMAEAIGVADPAFDMKTFSDDLWDGL